MYSIRPRAVLTVIVGTLLTILILVGRFHRPSRDSIRHWVATSGTPCTFDCSRCPTGVVTDTQEDFTRWQFDWQRDSYRFSLSEEQCDDAFGPLFSDLVRSVENRKHRPVTIRDVEANMEHGGSVRAMIYDGQFYVIAVNDAMNWWLQTRALATLSSIYRAIVSAKDPKSIPNIEFSMTLHDTTLGSYPDSEVNRVIWSFTRRAEDDEIWLMPDFGYWSFPEVHIGTEAEVMHRMAEVEVEYPFDKKIPKLMWRGTIDTAPIIRQGLVDKTMDKEWADVKGMNWGDPEKPYISMEDHCKYLYLAYTEGHSFSGRLKYMQNCHSVVVSHEMNWIVPTNYLLVKDGPDQNYVEVGPDFTGLEEAMEDLINNPEKTRMIADNQVKTYKQRYTTPAAEACYWRKMFRLWAEVSFEPEFYKTDPETGKRTWRGTPFESFMLMQKTHWD